MQRTVFRMLISCAMVLLSACSTETTYAPVVEISTIEPVPKAGVYQVRPHETLYSIVWRYGLDYRVVADWNHIQPPYIVYPGQMIYLRQQQPVNIQTSQVQIKPTILTEPSRAKEPHFFVKRWIWPVKGSIIQSYSATNKGINIAGYLGEPIYAAAAGKIVYCGDGLRGYGNLIILKHNSTYLSAYAHNQQLFVKEGEWVKQGQKIAAMGKTGTNKVMLHFEIRRAGKPVDPRSILGKY